MILICPFLPFGKEAQSSRWQLGVAETSLVSFGRRLEACGGRKVHRQGLARPVTALGGWWHHRGNSSITCGWVML